MHMYVHAIISNRSPRFMPRNFRSVRSLAVFGMFCSGRLKICLTFFAVKPFGAGVATIFFCNNFCIILPRSHYIHIVET